MPVIDSFLVRPFWEAKQPGPAPATAGKGLEAHGAGERGRGAAVDLNGGGHESAQILPPVSKFPEVRGPPGRPKQRPDELYAERGYDSDATRDIVRSLGIRANIARRGEERGSGLGHVRRVVERTISWFKGMHRLRTRYDRRLVIQQASNSLAAAVVCFHLATEAAGV